MVCMEPSRVCSRHERRCLGELHHRVEVRESMNHCDVVEEVELSLQSHRSSAGSVGTPIGSGRGERDDGEGSLSSANITGDGLGIADGGNIYPNRPSLCGVAIVAEVCLEPVKLVNGVGKSALRSAEQEYQRLSKNAALDSGSIDRCVERRLSADGYVLLFQEGEDNAREILLGD